MAGMIFPFLSFLAPRRAVCKPVAFDAGPGVGVWLLWGKGTLRPSPKTLVLLPSGEVLRTSDANNQPGPTTWRDKTAGTHEEQEGGRGLSTC
jgi:hypothetical protein